MRRTRILKNATAAPLYVQIDPFADLLYLLPDEQLTLVIYVDAKHEDDFMVEEVDLTNEGHQVVWLPYSHEYFLLEAGVEIHHTDYGSNVFGVAGPLCPESKLKGVSLAFIQHKQSG